MCSQSVSQLVSELVSWSIFQKTAPTNFLHFFMKIGNHNRKTIASLFFLRKFVFLLKNPKNPIFLGLCLCFGLHQEKVLKPKLLMYEQQVFLKQLELSNYHQITVISQTAAQQEHALLLINNKWSPLFTRATLNKRLMLIWSMNNKWWLFCYSSISQVK